MVLDFLANVACRVSAQRGLEGSHVGSVERLAHGRGVGRHKDELDVGMRQSMEGQELSTDVPGTHVHAADPWGTVAIGVHLSGVQSREDSHVEVGWEAKRNITCVDFGDRDWGKSHLSVRKVESEEHKNLGHASRRF